MNKIATISITLIVLFAAALPASSQITIDGPIKNLLHPKNEAEEKLYNALKDIREGPGYANVSERDGNVLRILTEAINAETVVEIGTSTGESAIWFAMALRQTGGKLYTHEINKRRIEAARENFKKAGVDDIITIIEGDAHETVKQHDMPIDIVFLDADKSGYPDYLDKLLPLVKPGGLVIAHNMNYPSPDPDYLEEITQNPELESMFLFMDSAGLGVTMKRR